MWQVLFGDADAVVGHGQGQSVALAAQGDGDMPALGRVFDGVLHQVLHQAGHQPHVDVGVDAAIYLLFQLHGLAGGHGRLVRDDLRQLGEVGALEGRLVRALVHARDVQQLADELGHAPRLPLDDLDGLGVVLRAFGVLLRVLALGEDDGRGRAQLVRGVGGEALFAVEGLLQAVEHAVEGGGQLVYLVAPAAQPDAGREVLAV